MKYWHDENTYSPVVKCCFFRWTSFWSPHEVFCSSYIYGRCWSRIWMMLSWHPWGNWVIGKLGRPLPKFHFLGHNSIIPQDKIVVSTSRFHGQWFWLDHCREDPAICICIIMQIKSAITEIASLPKNDDLSDHACYGNKSKDDLSKIRVETWSKKMGNKNITAAPELTRT